MLPANSPQPRVDREAVAQIVRGVAGADRAVLHRHADAIALRVGADGGRSAMPFPACRKRVNVRPRRPVGHRAQAPAGSFVRAGAGGGLGARALCVRVQLECAGVGAAGGCRGRRGAGAGGRLVGPARRARAAGGADAARGGRVIRAAFSGQACSLAERHFPVANSTGRCNGLAEHFGRRLEAEGLSRPFVQLSRHSVQLGL